MPWAQKMLQPYLTPEELPETQLLELYDYAMSFVERNHRDLIPNTFALKTIFGWVTDSKKILAALG